jgi:hypothetical protein
MASHFSISVAFKQIIPFLNRFFKKKGQGIKRRRIRGAPTKKAPPDSGASQFFNSSLTF